MSNYDNTDRGAVFPPRNQQLILQGKIDSKGDTQNFVLVKANTQAGDPIIHVYQKVGALFPNKSDNSKAPSYTGPLEQPGKSKRHLSAWKHSKDGMNYMSISVNDPMGNGRQSGDDIPNWDDLTGDELNDKIPF